MAASQTPQQQTRAPAKPAIWWSNAFLFLATHAAAACGVYHRPPLTVPSQTLVLTLVLMHLACFGITVGYHRLYSHRAFRASFGVRVVLAAMGTTAVQGSIKWWCLRHRLHHRFTDDEEYDPYCATRGMFFAHVGWIFYKSKYAKLELIDRDDLDRDPVVRIQHRYFVPLAVCSALVLPTALGFLWNDPLGAFIYGGLVARVIIWHSTFLVNSLAHWDGLQPFTDENTSRTNLLLALLTNGEGNHNFHHAFPHDFRSGPALLDWDPSKWVILALHRLGFVSGLRRARESDMRAALVHMHHKHQHGYAQTENETEEWVGQVWGREELQAYVCADAKRCVVVVDGFVVDVGAYLGEHPGGSAVLRKYAVRAGDDVDGLCDATWAFEGGMNKHSQVARRRMGELRRARLVL